MKTILELFLDALEIDYTHQFATNLYHGHPHRDNMYGLKKMLDVYGVNTVGVHIESKDLSTLNFPCILHTHGDFAIGLDCTEEKITYMLHGKKTEVAHDVFKQTWTGNALVVSETTDAVEPDLKKHEREEILSMAKLYSIPTLLVFAFLIGLANNVATETLSFFHFPELLLSIMGMAVCAMLMQKQLFNESKYGDRVCSLFHHADCNSVLDGPRAKVFGISWSKIGLGFFIANLHTFCLSAQNLNRDSIEISQRVSDSFTRHGIPDVLITLADSSGVLIDTLRTEWMYEANDFWWHKRVARWEQTFMIKAEHPDYGTVTMRLEMRPQARAAGFSFPELLMKRKMRDKELNEVLVTATRVQLAYKGDTIVVDAQAFRIPEGSMLDALVASVPGAEMKEDGTIYMHGRKVDYLTLNGKDFFKGRNRVMLDNLPYYVVSKLRFYEKDVPRSQMQHQQTGEKDYVMDVEMKQEYAVGYMANAEAGGGTDERWLARLFGLRFTDDSRLVLFGGANNINETRPPGAEGWNDKSKVLTGEKTTKMVGGSFYVEDKRGRYNENVEATVNWTDIRDEKRSTQETFLTGGESVFCRAQQTSRNNDFVTTLNNTLKLEKLGLRFHTKANYTNRRGNALSRSATFMSDPAACGSCVQILDSLFSQSASTALRTININKFQIKELQQLTSYNLGQDIAWDKALPWGDDMYINLNVNYDRDQRDDFSRYALTYTDPQQANKKQDRFIPQRRYHYSFGTDAGYVVHLYNGWFVDITYNYTHQYDDTDNPLYQLDLLASDLGFGVLPSQMEYLQTIDTDNSYRNRYRTQVHDTYLALKRVLNTKPHTLLYGIGADIIHRDESIDYQRTNKCYGIRRRYWFAEPSAYLDYRPNNPKRIGIKLNYDCHSSTPSLVQMLDILDTTDPLAITRGNPDLKSSIRHHIHLQVSRGRFGSGIWLETDVNLLDNLVANGFTYNPATGVYTYRPENVRGNWNSKTSFYWNRYLATNKQWILKGETAYDYVQNVDLTRVEGLDASQQSHVNHHVTSQNLTLSYTKGTLRLEVIGDFAWNIAKREQNAYGDVSAFDYSYGISGQYTLPWRIQLATDLKMYSHRGYEESSMNADELVWNASLSRPFLKGKLVVKLDAFDLLNQLSSTRYVVNGQGRTETWQLCMPRYAMFRVAYKFNKNPKKK